MINDENIELKFLRNLVFCYMMDNGLKEMIGHSPTDENENKRLRLKMSGGLNEKNIPFLKVELR